MKTKKKGATTGMFTVHFDVSEDVFYLLTQIAHQCHRSTNETASIIVHDWLNAVSRHVSPPPGSPKMTQHVDKNGPIS